MTKSKGKRKSTIKSTKKERSKSESKRKLRKITFDFVMNLDEETLKKAIEEDYRKVKMHVEGLLLDREPEEQRKLDGIFGLNPEEETKKNHFLLVKRLEIRRVAKDGDKDEVTKGNLFSIALQYADMLIRNQYDEIRSDEHHRIKKFIGASTSRMTQIKFLAEVFCQHPAMLKCPWDGDAIIKILIKIKSKAVKIDFCNGAGKCKIPNADLYLYLFPHGKIDESRSKGLSNELILEVKTPNNELHLLDGTKLAERRVIFGVSQYIQIKEEDALEEFHDDIEDSSGARIASKSVEPIIIRRFPYEEPIRKLSEYISSDNAVLTEKELDAIQTWAHGLFRQTLKDKPTKA